MSNKKLDGRVAVVSGASRGLGRSMAVALAEEGARLALVGRDLEKLAETQAIIREKGGEGLVFRADVTSESAVAAMASEIAAAFGGIDILINNAGINIRKPLVEFSLEEWTRVMDANLTSVFLMCRALIPLMKGRSHGRIVSMASMMSWISLPGRTPYCASKAGLLGLSRTLALELAPDNITVNCISPGPFATEMNMTIMQNPEVNQFFTSRIPLGRWGKIEDIGKLAVYLCSDDAGFITGTDIVIDGGWTAQ